ncbi:hypothetical protein [Luteibacter sp. Lutesp34]|uniref:hypothetical protein n=1 Tax=Luteibacter sp. Lutesp34 TaxID=3243030 RepID=UPI0039B59A6C
MKRYIGSAIIAVITTSAASASVLPVIDYANLGVNSSNLAANVANAATNLLNLEANKLTLASNALQMGQLELIRHALVDENNGTVKNYTINIDKSMTKVETNIAFNTEINADFTWIINEGSDEIIPIPFDVKDKLKKVMNGKGTGAYTSHYKTVADYEKYASSYGDDTAVESSRARKAANDAWVEALAMGEEALNTDAANLMKVLEFAKEARGHGRQLQVANSLAATEVDQLMKLRGVMLASEVARAAQTQAQADREARAVAIGKRLREGLDSTIEKTKLRSVSY